MIDSHCHIGFDILKENIEEIVHRAKMAGVEKILTVGCGKDSLPDLLTVLDKFDCVYGAFGIHPNESEEVITEAELTSLIHSHPKIIAVGESGLDYYYNTAPKEIQIQNFKTHIEVAKKLDLPVIVHTRDAEEDTIDLLRAGASSGQLRGVLHCFTGSRKLALVADEIGFYLSASGIITFKKTPSNQAYHAELLDTFSIYPLKKLLIETDAPYLAPVPMRGKTNEPAYIHYTLEKLANLKNISVSEMEHITTQNFYNLFFKGIKP